MDHRSDNYCQHIFENCHFNNIISNYELRQRITKYYYYKNTFWEYCILSKIKNLAIEFIQLKYIQW